VVLPPSEVKEKIMSDGRYYSITLEPDLTERPGIYMLKFSTMPGMSTAVGELRMADLDALADILRDREDIGDGGKITGTGRRPLPGEPCPHCGGLGSGCQCDIEYA
jgi:hypothetical protein